MQDWERIKDLVASALERPASERFEFLNDTCEPQLRAEVESLLNASTDGDFIETPAMDVHHGIDLDADSLIGTRVGPWLVVSRIGEGGMGTVYRATRQDEHYEAQVAIKVLRRGISSHFTVNRFRTERQILARLNHPNIARMLDGGTTGDGRPYFVMELVEGQPLDEYCDHRKLSTVDRVKLFRQVCSAVQYAHSNLIVHRDLKPTNILVTPDGVPKLLDFGIAKILNPTDNPEYAQDTMAVVRMMTPDYASPEQIRGEAVTTASDVYALGVVLYELLSGHHPYRQRKSALDLERIICEVDPERPSTAVKWVETVTDRHGTALVLTPEWVSGAREGKPEKLIRRLRGDLDNIVLHALRKDPQKRYESVGQLSADLLRHLHDEPVLARADTPLYRASKFAVRHKGGVAAAALVLLAIAAGTAVSVQQARLAHEERAKAERRFNDVRHLATSFLFEFHDSIRNLPGSTPARALVVKKALAYLDSLSREASEDPSLQRELAEAYEKLSDVQGSGSESNLGDTAGAILSIRKALALREPLAARFPQSLDDQMGLAAAYGRAGGLLGETGNTKESSEFSRKSFAVRERVFEAHPADLKMKRSLAIGYSDLGMGFVNVGSFEEALKARLKSLQLFEELNAVNPNRQNRRSVAVLHRNVSANFMRLRRFDESINHARKAVAIDEKLVQEKRDDVQSRRDVSFSYSALGEGLATSGHTREALDYYLKSLAIRKELSDEDPKDQFGLGAVGNMELRVARGFYEFRDYAAALDHHRKALVIRERIANADPANLVARVNVAESYGSLGSVYHQLGNKALAKANFVKSLAMLREMEDGGKLPRAFEGVYADVKQRAAPYVQ